MKICRFDDDRLGLVDGETLADVTAALSVLPPVRWPYPAGDAVIANWSAVAPEIRRIAGDAPRRPLAGATLKSPVANPTKIIGVARNRKNLDGESLDPAIGSGKNRQDGDPMHMFIKANSALAGPSDGVALRFTDRRIDPEAELAIVIGRRGTDITEADAMDHVFGYAIGLDMSMRGKEPASARKSIDGYAVVGPWVVTADEVANPDALATKLYVDGEILQDANTDQLAFGVRAIVANASRYFTLYPGDVIMAGTAASFAPIHPGSVMVADFEAIGRMEVAVRAHG